MARALWTGMARALWTVWLGPYGTSSRTMGPMALVLGQWALWH